MCIRDRYKMEFDFCAKKLIDSGIAWGDGQVVKEYVSKDMLRMDKMDVYRSNYMESYRDRIITGGDEKIDTDSVSYTHLNGKRCFPWYFFLRLHAVLFRNLGWLSLQIHFFLLELLLDLLGC